MMKKKNRLRLSYFKIYSAIKTRVFVAIIAVVFGLGACSGVPPYDGEGHESQAKGNNSFDYIQHEIEGQALYGGHAGMVCNPAVIFIHGAPGDWKAWGRYLGDKELSQKAFMMAVDRPGYGGSGEGTPELSLKTQAATIMKAAKKEHKGPFLLVGHSYGGPVQTQMAIDFPKDVSGLIMLAGAIDPVIQKSRWYHYAANTWLARRFLPEPLKVTTKEMLSLPKELRVQQEKLKDITAKTTVIQGGKDWLVPPGNADYAKQKLSNAAVKIIALPEQSHFIPWEQYDLVKSTILQNLPIQDYCK